MFFNVQYGIYIDFSLFLYTPPPSTVLTVGQWVSWQYLHLLLLLVLVVLRSARQFIVGSFPSMFPLFTPSGNSLCIGLLIMQYFPFWGQLLCFSLWILFLVPHLLHPLFASDGHFVPLLVVNLSSHISFFFWMASWNWSIRNFCDCSVWCCFFPLGCCF